MNKKITDQETNLAMARGSWGGGRRGRGRAARARARPWEEARSRRTAGTGIGGGGKDVVGSLDSFRLTPTVQGILPTQNYVCLACTVLRGAVKTRCFQQQELYCWLAGFDSYIPAHLLLSVE